MEKIYLQIGNIFRVHVHIEVDFLITATVLDDLSNDVLFFSLYLNKSSIHMFQCGHFGKWILISGND